VRDDGEQLCTLQGIELLPFLGGQLVPRERDVPLHAFTFHAGVDAGEFLLRFSARRLCVPREVTHRYVDPLAQVWLGAARRIGLRVVRTPDTYASTDGRGALAIAVDAELDADDSLGQMIFHELCHSLVEGEDSFAAPDWGMDNTGPEHDFREHACQRVQWVLAGRYGLRAVFAPTTDFRAFWDTLSGDVLADRTDPSVQLAIAGLRRAALPPWAPALAEALAASAQIAVAAAPFAARPTTGELAPLWLGVTAPPAPHPTGLPAGDGTGTCATCAWRFDRKPDDRRARSSAEGGAEVDRRGASRCRQADAKVDPTWPACERYEAALDCQTCGACCRAAYDAVDVAKRDPMVKKQPTYLEDRGTYYQIKRKGDRCSALQGGVVVDGKTSRYACEIYDDRPRTCRDFTLGSAHCLTARRRVGLSL